LKYSHQSDVQGVYVDIIHIATIDVEKHDANRHALILRRTVSNHQATALTFEEKFPPCSLW